MAESLERRATGSPTWLASIPVWDGDRAATTMPAVMARRSPEYTAFLKRLRAARVKAGLSQEEVVRRIGKPQSYLSKCESGERRVDVVELAALAKVYGVRITYFFG